MTPAAPASGAGTGLRSSTGLGIAAIVAAFFFVAVMSALGKEAAALPLGMVVFCQSGLALLLFLPLALKGGLAKLRTAHPLLHGVRAVAGLASQALMFVAVRRMPLMNAVLLANSAPLFIPLFSWLWLKQPASRLTLVGLVVGLAGVVAILKPDAALLRDPVSVIALASALCSALALVAVAKMARSERREAVLFYYFLLSSLVSLPFAAFQWCPLSPTQWAVTGAIGACMALSQILIIVAYRLAPADKVAPCNYSVVVFSGLIGWLVWEQQPDALDFLGVALVTGGGLISTVFGGPHTHASGIWTGLLERMQAYERRIYTRRQR